MSADTEAVGKAISLFRAGDSAGALATAMRLLETDEENVLALLVVAAVAAVDGDFETVLEYCTRALGVEPGNVDALYNAAVASGNLGRYDDALSYTRGILASDPDNIQARVFAVKYMCLTGDVSGAQAEASSILRHNTIAEAVYEQLAASFISVDDLQAALDIYDTAIGRNPAQGGMRRNAASICNRMGRFADALHLLASCLREAPHDVDLISMNATALKGAYGISRAIADIEGRISANQDVTSLRMLVADMLAEKGDHQSAIRSYESCVHDARHAARALHSIGGICEIVGDQLSAIDHYRQALRFDDNVSTILNLARLYDSTGESERALKILMDDHRIGNDGVLRMLFVDVLSRIPYTSLDDPDIQERLLDILDDDRVDSQKMSSSIEAYLVSGGSIPDVLFDEHLPSMSPDRILPFLVGLADNSLFLRYVSSLHVTSIKIEYMIAALRAFLLRNMDVDYLDSHRLRGLYSSIAIQAYMSGYVCPLGSDAPAVESLKEGMKAGEISASGVHLLVYAMYERIYDLPCFDEADDGLRHPVYGRLLDFQYYELKAVYRERDAIDEAAQGDEVSREVKEMYESSPYPLWFNMDVLMPVRLAEIIKSINPEFGDVYTSSGQTSVLVAGCGTGKHALMNASRIVSTSVDAIDLSSLSIAYARTRAARYNISKIRFHYLNILDVSSLGRSFDIIESVGVLHHMSSIAEGLHCLLSCLKDGGYINIGLYSRLGRRYISRFKEKYHDGAYMDDETIRLIRRKIVSSEDVEARDNVLSFGDFYNLNECRDMLFHQHEKCVDIPYIKGLLERAGLTFVGFEFSDKSIPEGYRRMFPADKGMTDLDNWAVYEESCPDAFASMYVFWSRKKLGTTP